MRTSIGACLNTNSSSFLLHVLIVLCFGAIDDSLSFWMISAMALSMMSRRFNPCLCLRCSSAPAAFRFLASLFVDATSVAARSS